MALPSPARRLQKSCLIALCAAEAVTITVFMVYSGIEPSRRTQGKQFDDIASFKAYVEAQPEKGADGDLKQASVQEAPEEAPTYIIQDAEGRVVLEYIPDNPNFTGVSYNPSQIFPITAYTRQDQMTVDERYNAVRAVLYLLMALEIPAALIAYLLLDKKARGRA